MPGLLDGQREQQHVERAFVQLMQQLLRLRLADVQVERGILPAQHRQQRRQQVGRDRGDDAEVQRARQLARPLAREVAEVAHLGEDAGRPLRDLPPLGGQPHALGPALQQLQAQLALQLLDLHRQGRLGDGAMLGRPAEVAEAGDGIEVAQLLERGHGY